MKYIEYIHKSLYEFFMVKGILYDLEVFKKGNNKECKCCGKNENLKCLKFIGRKLINSEKSVIRMIGE
jgi:hypothetical protein